MKKNNLTAKTLSTDAAKQNKNQAFTGLNKAF